MDDFTIGCAHNMNPPVDNKERQIWLWHGRLGHPSFGYMEHLFPSLFSNKSLSDLRCVGTFSLPNSDLFRLGSTKK